MSFCLKQKFQKKECYFLSFLWVFSHGVAIDRVGFGGGLALLWNCMVDVSFQSYSVEHIDVHISNKSNGVRWFFIGFYGYPELEKRKDSWQLLERIGSGRLAFWLCGGDFNEILLRDEMQGVRERTDSQMRNFRLAIE